MIKHKISSVIHSLLLPLMMIMFCTIHGAKSKTYDSCDFCVKIQAFGASNIAKLLRKEDKPTTRHSFHISSKVSPPYKVEKSLHGCFLLKYLVYWPHGECSLGQMTDSSYKNIRSWDIQPIFNLVHCCDTVIAGLRLFWLSIFYIKSTWKQNKHMTVIYHICCFLR